MLMSDLPIRERKLTTGLTRSELSNQSQLRRTLGRTTAHKPYEETKTSVHIPSRRLRLCIWIPPQHLIPSIVSPSLSPVTTPLSCPQRWRLQIRSVKGSSHTILPPPHNGLHRSHYTHLSLHAHNSSSLHRNRLNLYPTQPPQTSSEKTDAFFGCSLTNAGLSLSPHLVR